MDLIKNYMDFLDNSKTERRCNNNAVKLAEKAGYRDLFSKKSLKPGDKVYYNKMGKSLILFNIGSRPLSDGMQILGAHIDSPRLDVKTNPVYESDGIVYLNTQYYGGIKNYQWLAMPLALNGFVFLKDGSSVDINIGDKADDPVFCITDVLPHLGHEQMKKSADSFIDAEKLDVVLGSAHKNGTSGKEVSNKSKILEILKEKYCFDEEDFQSAELEIVPAGKSRYLGLDKSLVLGYGQDDRVCAYTSLVAMLESTCGERTKCCILVDKEEIGSAGATGMDSHLFDNALSEVVARMSKDYDELTVRRSLANSRMLSSDVSIAYDPLNPDLYDKDSNASLNGGVTLYKFTGVHGKGGSSDANPEFIAYLRRIFTENNVDYQIREYAKVDVGGFGTIAKYSAGYGMQVIDCGVPLLSMHAPWEVSSTYDIYQTYIAYKAFLAN